MFDHIFTPRDFTITFEGSTDRIRYVDRSNACFTVINLAAFSQTIYASMLARVITPSLIGDSISGVNGVMIETDSYAQGAVDAVALPGYAQASVEANLRVLSYPGMVEIGRAGPIFFGGSHIVIPGFWGVGYPFSGTAYTDTRITDTLTGTDQIVVELRISSWATAAGWANANADIRNACITQIHVYTF